MNTNILPLLDDSNNQGVKGFATLYQDDLGFTSDEIKLDSHPAKRDRFPGDAGKDKQQRLTKVSVAVMQDCNVTRLVARIEN